ncbi:hypothetical protein GCM10009109_28040 [Marinobacterium sediminicola]
MFIKATPISIRSGALKKADGPEASKMKPLGKYLHESLPLVTSDQVIPEEK